MYILYIFLLYLSIFFPFHVVLDCLSVSKTDCPYFYLIKPGYSAITPTTSMSTDTIELFL